MRHHLLVISLGTADAVADAAVPRADGLLDVVLHIVYRLHEEEHLLGFCQIEAVLERIALLALARLEDIIAFCHQNGSDLHCSHGVAAHGTGVAPTLHLDDGIHHRVPVELLA